MATSITRIATFQRSLRELGRIRLGQQEEYTDRSGKTRTRPAKLSTFRLTSASREYIEAAVEAYGSTIKKGDKVRAWESPRGREYETIIESETLDVLVPPGNSVMQAFELWTAGGCQRRCDGITQETGDACACPADINQRTELAAKGQACKPTTRLWVILPKLPDLGRWRLEAHGYYAAVELAGMAEIAGMATSRGIMLNARLRIDQRTRKIPGQGTRNYIVPVLELPDTNFASLVEAGFIPTTAAQIESGSVPALGEGQRQITPPKQPRAERPALGPPPGLPGESDFARPAAPDVEPVAPPDEPAAPSTVGGWPVEEPSPSNSPQEPPETPNRTPAPPESAPRQDAAAAAATDVEDGDFTLPDDAGPVTAGPTTYDAFKAAVHKRGIPGKAIQAALHRLHGNEPAEFIRDGLDDEARGVLLAAVVAEHEAAPAA